MTAGPVWDYDIGAGNNDYGLGTKEACLPNQDIINSNELWVAGEHKWFGKLLKCDEFLELVREKLVEYKPYFMETVALLQTDGKNAKAYYSLYGKAMERNFIKWDIMGSYVWPNPQVIVDIKTLKGQLNYLRTWLIERYYVVCDWYDVHI